MSIVLRRLIAFLLDTLILAVYAGALFFFVSPVVRPLFAASALQAELTGFVLLTLPFVLYFILSESSARSGSIGKRIMGLSVLNSKTKKRIGLVQSVKRSVIKFLPWELAHFAIWNAFIFESDLSSVAMVALVFCYILAGGYIAGLVMKSHRPLYDRLAGTIVIKK
ncbi:MAG TPA: RDD family protein [Candidatus Saccharimonadales bacterium]